MNVTNLIPWNRGRSSELQNEERHPFLTLHNEINRLFDEAWRGFDTPRFGFLRSLAWPRVDVVEGEKAITVTAELAGFEEKDVEVLFAENILTLRGERKYETDDGEHRMKERFHGRFERRIALDAEVDADKVSAAFKNGLLTVTLPKLPESRRQTRRIPISS